MIDGVIDGVIDGRPIPEEPDLQRMRGERHAKLQDLLERAGIDGLVLLGTSAVSYATGAVAPAVDSSRAVLDRPVAVVVPGSPFPHLYTSYQDGAPPELPGEHMHGPVYPETDDGAAALQRQLEGLCGPGARLACDEMTHAMLRQGMGSSVSASPVLGAAKVCKTPDELACVRAAQCLNELAMWDVLQVLRPGVRQCDLSAVFLQRAYELGASAGIDPIWQVMPRTRAEGPWTVHGDVAFPTSTTDRILREGDVIWVDSGVTYAGYASDFGRTWIVGAEPDGRQQSQFSRWSAVVSAVVDLCKPGATALELDRAAMAADGGTRPWLEHFYLAHGVGTDSAEMPLVGTDLGEKFDERLVLQPGMVLVLEPVIWDDGAAGYRSEDIVAVTDDGWTALSTFPYDPFGGPS